MKLRVFIFAYLVVIFSTSCIYSQTQLQQAFASDRTSYDKFGYSVAVSGNTVLIGSQGDDNNSGSAYVFTFNGTQWHEEAKLVPTDRNASDYFGRSVAISGNIALVGSYQDDDNGTQSGSAYLFRRTESGWVQEAKLLPSDASSWDYFGSDVALDGDIAVVTSTGDDSYSGSAYVFRHDCSSWIQEQKLIATDRESGDHFGTSCAVSGSLIIVGAPRDDDNGENSGAAYIFKYDQGIWNQEQKLLANDGVTDDRFGFDVDICRNTIVVGSPRDDFIPSGIGSAYVFDLNDSVWQQTDKLLASDGASGDGFGWSVSVYNKIIVIGAPFDDSSQPDSGSAYIFDLEISDWIENEKINPVIIPSSDQRYGQFGYSTDIIGDGIIIGGPYYNCSEASLTNCGSVFLSFPTDMYDSLERIDSFLIRQMDLFNPERPQDQPPLIQSYGWNPNVPYTVNNQIGRSENLPYRGDLYDQSVAACYFLSRSKVKPEFMQRAKKLLDTILFLQENDPNDDGRTRAAYWANDLISGNSASIMDPSVGTGNLAWQGIALTRYYHSLPTDLKDPNYLDAAIRFGNWIIDNTKTGDPNNYPLDPGGFTCGLESWDANELKYKSTENNIDVFVFAQNLYYLTHDNKWKEMATHAQKFVKAMYDINTGRYFTGTENDGVTPNTSPIPADAQTWSALAGIDNCDRKKQALKWAVNQGLREPNSYGLLTQDTVSSNEYFGILFSDEGSHIQCEMTAGAAMSIGLNNRQKDMQMLMDSLSDVQLFSSPLDDGIADSNGIPSTPNPDGALNGFGGTYPNLLHVASSAWTGLAILTSQGNSDVNPLDPLTPIPGDFNSDNIIDIDDLLLLSNAWLSQLGEEDWNANCDIDRNDTRINLVDYFLFAENWLVGVE